MTEVSADKLTNWRLECTNLDIRRAGRLVLQSVSLALRADECVSLVGPNGSGKTTLMLALLGLLTPAEGAVRWNGRAVHQLSARARARFAAYVPQIVESVPSFRVYDVVAGGRFPHTGPLRPWSVQDRTAVQAALERCGLAALAGRPFNAISGGERQKTLIAAAMAQHPQMLFLDEPGTALDPAYQLELVGILRAWQQAGRGVLVISHDLQLPAALSGRIVALKDGQIAADGPAAEVLTPATLNRIYGARFAIATTAAGSQVVLPEWWHAG